MASHAKTPLTLEEHRALGRRLFEARSALLDAQVQIGNGYALSKGLDGKATKALDAVDALRSAMETQASHDLPHEDWSPHLYYPALRSRSTE
jgi:hypothetical protein